MNLSRLCGMPNSILVLHVYNISQVMEMFKGFFGEKFLIPGFFWVGKFGKSFFGGLIYAGFF